MSVTVVGIISIIVVIITFIALQYLSEIQGNAIHATLGLAHEYGIQNCQRVDDERARDNCIDSVNSTHTMGVLGISAITGFVTFIGIFVIVEKVFGGF